MSVLNKTRTFIPNVPGMITYHNDGRGRDTYISMDNGGFWKRPAFVLKEEPSNKHVTKLPDLSSYKPLNRYYQDGQGRDFYIAKAINKDWVNTSAVISSNLFRDNNVINSNPLRLKKKKYSKFEKRLLDRIFYGKTEGLNERYMSPKVKFGVKKKKPEYDCFGNLLNGEDDEEEEVNLKTAPNRSLDKNNEDEKNEEGENEGEKKEGEEEEKYEDNWKYKYTHYDDFPEEDVMLKKVKNCFNYEDKDYRRQYYKGKYPWVY
jgi:hypothetical protein